MTQPRREKQLLSFLTKEKKKRSPEVDFFIRQSERFINRLRIVPNLSLFLGPK